MNYFLDPIKQYVNFKGRATRKQFWLFQLWYLVIFFLLGIIETALIGKSALITSLFQLALLLPSLAIGARRLHDTNKSGWWWLIALTGIGVIGLIIFWVLPSDKETNKYGAPVRNA